MSSYAGGGIGIYYIYAFAFYIVYIIVCGLVVKNFYDNKKFNIPEYGYLVILGGLIVGVPGGLMVLYNVYDNITYAAIKARNDKIIAGQSHEAAPIPVPIPAPVSQTGGTNLIIQAKK